MNEKNNLFPKTTNFEQVPKLLPCYPKWSSIRQDWRELGGYFQVHFRLKPDGRLDLIGRIRSEEEISLMCEALNKYLLQEFEVQQQRRWLTNPKDQKESTQQGYEGSNDITNALLKKQASQNPDSIKGLRQSA